LRQCHQPGDVAHGSGDAATQALDERRAWLDPPGADAAEIKKRTIVTRYNARPAWFATRHAALDRAVWAASGGDDPDPATVAQDAYLARLLALNVERRGGA